MTEQIEALEALEMLANTPMNLSLEDWSIASGKIQAALSQSAARIAELEADVKRLRKRETDLLAANNRYLQRARDAEAT